MASIQKTASGNWEVRYKDPVTGRHRGKTHKRKALAQKFLHEIEHSILSGSYIPAERGGISVAEWARLYSEERADLAQSTRDRNDQILRRHVEPRWASTAIKDLKHHDLQRWVGELSKQVSPRTVRKIVGVVSAAMDAAVRDRRVPDNPCRGLPLPPVQPTKGDRLTHDQVELMIANVRGPREELIVLILAYCGLRWSELAGLRVREIDLARRRLNIVQVIVTTDSGLVVKAPKSYQHRSVPMPPFVAEAVERAMKSKGPDDLLVTSARGTPLRNRNERRSWLDAAVASAGAPGLTPHGMRRTAASIAISVGASVLSVQRMLGHRSAKVTLDTYADLFDDDLDSLGKRIGELRVQSDLRDSYVPRLS